jgi:non-heme chloroperoxidase
LGTITTKDGKETCYKDWGRKGAPPIVFRPWPLSSDDWDTRLLYFRDKGNRVIAHEGLGRSAR